MEFKVSVQDDDEPVIAQLALDLVQASFNKPKGKEQRHLRLLYVKGHIDGRPMTKMLVDGGAAVNIMPYIFFQKLGFGKEDMIKTDMVLRDYEGKTSSARGAINVELAIGSKALPTTFFIIDGKGSYNLLLE